MILFKFYRAWASILAAAFVFVYVKPLWWFAAGVALAIRILWAVVDRFLEKARVERLFRRHGAAFKQLCGPYGIRIANKAEKDWRVKKSLAEVFEVHHETLKKNVEQLEMLDTLFGAGMRPEGDEYLIHDLKLKYGKYRLERENGSGDKNRSSEPPIPDSLNR